MDNYFKIRREIISKIVRVQKLFYDKKQKLLRDYGIVIDKNLFGDIIFNIPLEDLNNTLIIKPLKQGESITYAYPYYTGEYLKTKKYKEGRVELKILELDKEELEKYTEEKLKDSVKKELVFTNYELETSEISKKILNGTLDKVYNYFKENSINSNKKFIFAISGKRGSGKNEVSTIIQKLLSDNSEIDDFKEESFARPIKEAAALLYNRRYEHFNDRTFKELVCNYDPQGRTHRELLQQIGDALSKNVDYNIFTNCLIKRISEYNHVYNIVITDLRFKREKEALEEKFKDNLITIRVIRPDLNNSDSVDSHISENDLDDVPNDKFTITIYNDGSLKCLENKVKEELLKLGILNK